MKGLGEELLENLKLLAKAKRLDEKEVLESLKESLIVAARKYTGIQKHFEVEIDEETSEIKVFLSVEVVEDFPDYEGDLTAEEVAEMDEKFMLIDDATDYDEEAEEGDQLYIEVDLSEFGRQTVQTAKQILLQKIRESERRRIVEEYSDRIGMLVQGEVRLLERAGAVVALPTTEALLPIRDQLRRDRVKIGDEVLAVIKGVSDNPKGAQVLLSRTSSLFLTALLEREVPEVYDGVIEIKGVSRDAGNRSKVAVWSDDDKIDPVGSLVGSKGSRIQGVVRELSQERIDVIQWSADFETYVKRCFQPADVLEIHKVPTVGRIVIVVGDDDVALAFGKGRQNARLASQLLKRSIDIYAATEWSELSDMERTAALTPREGDRLLEVEVEEVEEESRDKFSELDALFSE